MGRGFLAFIVTFIIAFRGHAGANESFWAAVVVAIVVVCFFKKDRHEPERSNYRFYPVPVETPPQRHERHSEIQPVSAWSDDARIYGQPHLGKTKKHKRGKALHVDAEYSHHPRTFNDLRNRTY